jgi:hypothetical protein
MVKSNDSSPIISALEIKILPSTVSQIISHSTRKKELAHIGFILEAGSKLCTFYFGCLIF